MALKILVIGGGGRENALCRALRCGAEPPTLLAAPGNPGIAPFAKLVPIAADDVAGLVELAVREKVDMVVPGPEVPLALGIADALAKHEILCCGPKKVPAQLEASKAFTRELAARASVPGPEFVVVRDAAELAAALSRFKAPPVVKADGLAAGKGVFLPDTHEECAEVARKLLAGELGEAGRTVVLEERLVGTEASLFYACFGTEAVTLPHARDYKRLSNDDEGPNTGGMGAVSPSPNVNPSVEVRVRNTLVEPVLRELAAAGTPYCGFLYCGVMLTKAGPKLLEFNVRFGDPEAQVILPRLRPGHFLALCLATAKGRLEGLRLAVDPRFTCGITLAAHGYPGPVRTGDVINVDKAMALEDRWVEHAGTALDDGKLVTAGGRVMTVVARGKTAQKARELAYEGLQYVRFDGMHYRSDVGLKK